MIEVVERNTQLQSPPKYIENIFFCGVRFASVVSSSGATWTFSKLQKFSLDDLTFDESEKFSDSSVFVIQKNRFPFSTKKSLTCGVKYEKLNLRKT